DGHDDVGACVEDLVGQIREPVRGVPALPPGDSLLVDALEAAVGVDRVGVVPALPPGDVERLALPARDRVVGDRASDDALHLPGAVSAVLLLPWVLADAGRLGRRGLQHDAAGRDDADGKDDREKSSKHDASFEVLVGPAWPDAPFRTVTLGYHLLPAR